MHGIDNHYTSTLVAVEGTGTIEIVYSLFVCSYTYIGNVCITLVLHYHLNQFLWTVLDFI